MENPTKEEQESFHRIYDYAAQLMIEEQKSAYEVKKKLIQMGLDDEMADIIANKVNQKVSLAIKEKSDKDILHGALWCGGGLLITMLTYAAASNGGIYILAWGAILYGGIRLFKGISNS
jgi:dolichol kinase